jgi:hypothetical protein
MSAVLEKLIGVQPGHPQSARGLFQQVPNLTMNSVRTMGQQVELTFDQERAVADKSGHIKGLNFDT